MSGGLAIAGLVVSLGGRDVLRGVDVRCPAGTVTAIVGPNGAGKSTLLRAIVGLLPSTGSIALDGDALAPLDRRARARRIAYLPQGHEVHWPLPARDIVALGRLPHGAADPDRLSPEDAARVEAAMTETEILHLADRPVSALSGGERARVALARVFAAGAPVLLADEPIAALDPRHQLDVAAALRRRAEAGAVVALVTHDLGLAARFADRVLVLRDGRVAAAGPPEEALAPGVLSEVFDIAAYRAVHEGRPVLVPWA